MAGDREEPSGDQAQIFEDCAARLVHDLRGRVMTIRNILALAEDNPDLRTAIEAQLGRMGRRLDDFWAEVVPESTGAEQAGVEGSSVAAHGAMLNILYVDDDEVHRDIGGRLLTQLGHKVTLCADGLAAFDLCRQEAFDLIFLDEHAPVMSGTRFARTWPETMPPMARPYMVGMSNDPRAEALRLACLEAGMQDYLEKPVTAGKLEKLLTRACEVLGASRGGGSGSG